METILCAAIHYFIYINSGEFHSVSNKEEYGGIVLCGFRHPQIISQYKKLTGNSTGPSIGTQGFLTSKNRFVGRKEAAIIALKAGQIKVSKSELYSEDLY